ncbi:MAG: saccharopine dehydrogenase NADP-binding domain-containing protein [Rickettsiales bacterium]|nr:saccharopine dehydrogenase NADP-binding domain-containing protein [Rickettsiales bacterium]
MVTNILIIGGYGNFGSFIARKLASESNIALHIGGRNLEKAQEFARALEAKNPVQAVRLDIHNDIESSLEEINPDIVIHTSGPFQNQNYRVAVACIETGCHYIDLADAREFVVDINSLDNRAKDAHVLVCSGASSVPCLTAAVIDRYHDQFHPLEAVEYAISTAQMTNRGLATTKGVLSYAGKPFETLIDGSMQSVYGWMDIKWRRFWKLNQRGISNCDVPDLDLFPHRYPSLKNIRFRAGLELKTLQVMLAFFAWLVKIRLLPSLQPLSWLFWKTSFLFDWLGSNQSGFYMSLSGPNVEGNHHSITYDLVAKNGDGIYIPCIPAIILAKKISNNNLGTTGATACIDLISLEEYQHEMSDFDIEWQTSENLNPAQTQAA